MNQWKAKAKAQPKRKKHNTTLPGRNCTIVRKGGFEIGQSPMRYTNVVHMSSLRSHCVCFNQRLRQRQRQNVCSLAEEKRWNGCQQKKAASSKSNRQQINQVKVLAASAGSADTLYMALKCCNGDDSQAISAINWKWEITFIGKVEVSRRPLTHLRTYRYLSILKELKASLAKAKQSNVYIALSLLQGIAKHLVFCVYFVFIVIRVPIALPCLALPFISMGTSTARARLSFIGFAPAS